MTTIVVQISNTDNKLSQSEWADFVKAVRKLLSATTHKVHFEGGAPWDASHQNACWVAELTDGENLELQEKLAEIRESFKQDSVAVTLGETTFI